MSNLIMTTLPIIVFVPQNWFRRLQGLSSVNIHSYLICVILLQFEHFLNNARNYLTLIKIEKHLRHWPSETITTVILILLNV